MSRPLQLWHDVGIPLVPLVSHPGSTRHKLYSTVASRSAYVCNSIGAQAHEMRVDGSGSG